MRSRSITDLQDPFEFDFNYLGQPNFWSPVLGDGGKPFAGPPVAILAPPALTSEAVESLGAQSGPTTVTVLTTGGITINLLFDAAAMAAPASFRAGIQQAASILTASISDKITVNIKIDYSGTGGGAAAGPDAGLYESYTSIRADLVNNATSGDTTFNALPGGSSVQGQSNVAVWNAQLKLWGLLGANDTTTDDGSATFATDINPSLLVGVALHELTHAMGRVPYGTAPDIFDLFRFTSAGTRLFSGSATAPVAYFSVDGGNTKLADYGRTSDSSDFLNGGVQGSSDPFNEFYSGGTLQSLSAVDKAQLDALGFHTAAAQNGFVVSATASQAIQGGPAVTLLSGAPTITDPAHATLSSATIKIANAGGSAVTGDELYVNGQQSGTVDGGLVTVGWNDVTKTLNLVGNVSIATYETLLNQITYQDAGTNSSTGSHPLRTTTWTVNDGAADTAATSQIAIERAPVVTAATVTLNSALLTVAASSLFTASDPDSDAITTYAFKDTGNGHFVLNGAAQANNLEIDVTAAQLSQLTYQNGVGTNSLQIRVNDGTQWGAWQSFSVTGPVPLDLAATASGQTLTGGALDDTLSDGGFGPVTMIGGTGNDTYVVSSVGDVVTEAGYVPPSGFTIKGAADLNGDGELDALLTNGTVNEIQLLHNGVAQSTTVLPSWSGWSVQGFVDLNGDGHKDVLYQDGSGNQWGVFLNGTTFLYSGAAAGQTADAVQPIGGTGGGIDTVLSSISYTLPNGVENLTLTVGAGAINGTGNAANNAIVGNESNNILTGAGGTDTLTGGAGSDTFMFATGDSSAVAGKHDLITDFLPGTDKIDLTGIDADISTAGVINAFHFLGTAAFDGTAGGLDTSYDSSRGVTVLQGDVNGDKVADFVIDLTGNLTLSQSDFTAGSLLLPLTLAATASGQTLTGGALDDTLSDGGFGPVTMIGGTGNDTYVVSSVGDVVTEAGYVPPSGFTIKGAADLNGDGELDALLTNGTVNEIQLLHNGVAQSTTVLPSWSGWSVQGFVDLNGDGHKDVLYQDGSGNQWGVFLNGTTFLYSGAAAGQTADAVQPIGGTGGGIDTVLSSISYTLPNGVENLTLTVGAGAINGTGNAANNAIVGNESNNILTGAGGTDTLTGGAGSDTFMFATGDSSAVAGKHDLITDFLPGTDKIDLTGIDADISTAGVINAFHFLGTAAFDGTAGGLDTSYDSSRGVTVLQGDVNGDKVADFVIDLTGNLTLSQSDFTAGSLLLPLTLAATASGQTLTGGALDDTLSDGGFGPVTMIGGTGNDTYVVSSVGDVVTEAGYVPPSGFTIKGAADLNGDGELDALLTNGTVNEIQLLHNGVAQSTTVLPSWSGWSVQGFVDLNGDGHKDVLYQDGSGNQWGVFLNGTTFLYSGAAAGQTADAVQPIGGTGGGIDTVLSSISYTLPNGVENLTLTVGAGAINGTGNAANNAIVGNESNNILTGAGGTDTFVFNPAFGQDTISDFHPGQDIIQLDHTIFANVASILSHTTDDGHGNAIITLNANNTITLNNITAATLLQHQSDFHIV